MNVLNKLLETTPLTKAQIKTAITNGLVYINGERVCSPYTVVTDDMIPLFGETGIFFTNDQELISKAQNIVKEAPTEGTSGTRAEGEVIKANKNEKSTDIP